ncbi:glycosyltransferase [Clostridia bacterium]|nr:glycosyltransferase [Clostridia bacterium]
MKVLYLGSVIKTEDCTKYLGPSVAGNKMQMGILKGLKKILVEDLYVLTETPIAAFPREKKSYIGSGSIRLTNDIDALKVPFINIFIIKQIYLIINAFVMICKWAKKNGNKKKVIICFNAFPYVAMPIILASKLFSIKTICIFADPPVDVVRRSLIGRVAKYIEDRSVVKNIKKFDGLIVLNEKSIEKYASNSKYILVDGGFDLDCTPKNQPGGQWLSIQENDMVKMVFSGALFEYNGIKNLIKAVRLVDSDRLCLEIYGSGPLEHYIEQASKEDNRVRFMGNVPNSEMIRIQQEAGILINPRHVKDPISLYTFPSKIIEYLLSGTPVITTKLNGLTKEYLDNVFVTLDETPAEIANTIDFVLKQDKDCLIQKATAAREFVIQNKNWNVWIDKIIEFIYV